MSSGSTSSTSTHIDNRAHNNINVADSFTCIVCMEEYTIEPETFNSKRSPFDSDESNNSFSYSNSSNSLNSSSSSGSSNSSSSFDYYTCYCCHSSICKNCMNEIHQTMSAQQSIIKCPYCTAPVLDTIRCDSASFYMLMSSSNFLYELSKPLGIVFMLKDFLYTGLYIRNNKGELVLPRIVDAYINSDPDTITPESVNKFMDLFNPDDITPDINYLRPDILNCEPASYGKDVETFNNIGIHLTPKISIIRKACDLKHCNSIQCKDIVELIHSILEQVFIFQLVSYETLKSAARELKLTAGTYDEISSCFTASEHSLEVLPLAKKLLEEALKSDVDLISEPRILGKVNFPCGSLTCDGIATHHPILSRIEGYGGACYCNKCRSIHCYKCGKRIGKIDDFRASPGPMHLVLHDEHGNVIMDEGYLYPNVPAYCKECENKNKNKNKSENKKYENKSNEFDINSDINSGDFNDLDDSDGYSSSSSSSDESYDENDETMQDFHENSELSSMMKESFGLTEPDDLCLYCGMKIERKFDEFIYCDHCNRWYKINKIEKNEKDTRCDYLSYVSHRSILRPRKYKLKLQDLIAIDPSLSIWLRKPFAIGESLFELLLHEKYEEGIIINLIKILEFYKLDLQALGMRGLDLAMRNNLKSMRWNYSMYDTKEFRRILIPAALAKRQEDMIRKKIIEHDESFLCMFTNLLTALRNGENGSMKRNIKINDGRN